MKRQYQLLIALPVLAGLVLAACAGGAPAPSASPAGTWELVSYGDPSNLTPALPDVDTFVEFKDGQMGGNVGCNGFGGEYSVDGDTITFGPVMSTMMYCEAIAEQEAGTLAVFQEKAKFVLDGDMLTITSADGSSAIVLTRK